MTDWSLVAKIAGGGFGITILALVILSLAAWIVGLVVQKTKAKPEKAATKDK
jgi:Na+-transporting methylmalonyl-CoA/oxaloacetate decarboxylase gamma subunit